MNNSLLQGQLLLNFAGCDAFGKTAHRVIATTMFCTPGWVVHALQSCAVMLFTWMHANSAAVEWWLGPGLGTGASPRQRCLSSSQKLNCQTTQPTSAELGSEHVPLQADDQHCVGIGQMFTCNSATSRLRSSLEGALAVSTSKPSSVAFELTTTLIVAACWCMAI